MPKYHVAGERRREDGRERGARHRTCFSCFQGPSITSYLLIRNGTLTRRRRLTWSVSPSDRSDRSVRLPRSSIGVGCPFTGVPALDLCFQSLVTFKSFSWKTQHLLALQTKEEVPNVKNFPPWGFPCFLPGAFLSSLFRRAAQ